MQHFEFYTARHIEDALTFLSEKGERCKVIAGGTDLIPALRKENIHPDFVLNVLELRSLNGITELNHSIRIGSTVTFTEMVGSDILNHFFPSLAQAAASVGGPQIRNRGTIGGNIANASPAADVLPAILALDGELELESKKLGTRRLPLSEAIVAPYRAQFRQDEILTGIFIKKLEPGTRSAFTKLGRRNAMARARMNLSVILRLNNEEVVEELKIVPGAVMPVAKRMERAEKMLIGKKPETSLVEATATAIVEEMVERTGVRWSTEYKVPVMKSLSKRILGELLT
jgi:carbon-monoxide dehydrogenase medium subunit/xanthine dehydrogenase FAD-binding subunit